MPQDPKERTSVNHFSKILLDLFNQGLDVTISNNIASTGAARGFTAKFSKDNKQLDKNEFVLISSQRSA